MAWKGLPTSFMMKIMIGFYVEILFYQDAM